MQMSSFSSPIPPPNILKGYNDIIPNGAERIIAQSEIQLNHRINLENFAVKAELKQSGRGQIFGFILGVIVLGLATILATYKGLSIHTAKPKLQLIVCPVLLTNIYIDLVFLYISH